MNKLKSEVRAADYRSHARAASAAGRATVLGQVRDRQEAAAAAWRELASREDHRSAHARRVARLAEAAAHDLIQSD